MDNLTKYVRIYQEGIAGDSPLKSLYVISAKKIYWVKVVQKGKKFEVLEQREGKDLIKISSRQDLPLADIDAVTYVREQAQNLKKQGYEIIDEIDQTKRKPKPSILEQKEEPEEGPFEISGGNIKHLSEEESEKYFKRSKGIEFD